MSSTTTGSRLRLYTRSLPCSVIRTTVNVDVREPQGGLADVSGVGGSVVFVVGLRSVEPLETSGNTPWVTICYHHQSHHSNEVQGVHTNGQKKSWVWSLATCRRTRPHLRTRDLGVHVRHSGSLVHHLRLRYGGHLWMEHRQPISRSRHQEPLEEKQWVR